MSETDNNKFPAKTTELYTKTIQINNKNISSPLDKLLKK